MNLLDILVSGSVTDVKPGKEEGPAGLPGVYPLGTAKILEVLVVCDYRRGTPSSQCHHSMPA